MVPAAAATAMLYSSVQGHSALVSHPNFYAGYIEIAAAQQLLDDISINVVVAGTAVFPPVPNPPLNNKKALYVTYDPHAMHYCALLPRSAWYVLRRTKKSFLRHLLILTK